MQTRYISELSINYILLLRLSKPIIVCRDDIPELYVECNS